MHSHAVRPLAEYNSVTWSPVAKHDIELVEKVQRRFTKTALWTSQPVIL